MFILVIFMAATTQFPEIQKFHIFNDRNNCLEVAKVFDNPPYSESYCATIIRLKGK